MYTLEIVIPKISIPVATALNLPPLCSLNSKKQTVFEAYSPNPYITLAAISIYIFSGKAHKKTPTVTAEKEATKAFFLCIYKIS